MVYHQNTQAIFMNNEFVLNKYKNYLFLSCEIIHSYKQQRNILQLMHVVQVINVMYNNSGNNAHAYGMMEDNYVKLLV
jgi:hypothetical protein